MGFLRFRRTIKLGPLGRINLGKTGASLSVGVRGAHVNFGPRGTRMTAGLPGTGLSYTTRLGNGGASVQSSYSSGFGGCLKAFGIMVLCSMGLGVFVGMAKDSVTAAFVFLAIFIGAWVLIARAIRKSREAKARAQYDAYQAEQARLAAAHQSEVERRRAERWNYLVGTYGDDAAQKIWAGRAWLGCTVPMLNEMLGPPAGFDEKVLKTKVKHTYKYKPTGTNRYALRIFVEDGLVTGWEDKDD